MNFNSGVLQIPIEEIVPNRFQPRLNFDRDSLNDLATSIKMHGIIQPLVLRKNGDKYEIIAGERRYRAAIMAGLVSVPAVLTNIDDKAASELAVAENVQREALNPIEEAKSYDALLKQGYMSKEVLAQKMGLPITVLENKLNLLSLTPEVQDALFYNRISERHARSLLNVKEPKEQIKWLNNVIDKRMTVKELDNEISKEYGNLSTNVDINRIKNESIDINLPNTTPPVEVPKQVNTSGPVSLGEKPTNRFFNNLEDESVNMNMMENVNPLNNNYMTFNESIDNQNNNLPNQNMMNNNQNGMYQNDFNNQNMNNSYQVEDNGLNNFGPMPQTNNYQPEVNNFGQMDSLITPVPQNSQYINNSTQNQMLYSNDSIPYNGGQAPINNMNTGNIYQDNLATNPNLYTDNMVNSPVLDNNQINNPFVQNNIPLANQGYSNNMQSSMPDNLSISKDVLPAKTAILNVLNTLTSEYQISETDEDLPDKLVITITINKG